MQPQRAASACSLLEILGEEPRITSCIDRCFKIWEGGLVRRCLPPSLEVASSQASRPPLSLAHILSSMSIYGTGSSRLRICRSADAAAQTGSDGDARDCLCGQRLNLRAGMNALRLSDSERKFLAYIASRINRGVGRFQRATRARLTLALTLPGSLTARSRSSTARTRYAWLEAATRATELRGL
jgi:hypothetical protein